MNTTHAKELAVAAALIAATSSGAAIAATTAPASGAKPGPSHSKNWTPNDCIRLNGGDYNACNVGNSGRGDLPYQPIHR